MGIKHTVTGMQMKSGQYTGDGTDNRNINIGIDLASKSEVLLILKNGTATGAAIFRCSQHAGDATSIFQSAVDVADAIQAFTSTGFQVGTDGNANNAADTIFWVVLYKD